MLALSELTQNLFLKTPRYPRTFRATDGKIKPTKKWKGFRTRMLIRDNYTCQVCGTQRNRWELSIHHIKPCRSHPWLCYVPSNVITVCRDTVDTCHTDLDKKGWLNENK